MGTPPKRADTNLTLYNAGRAWPDVRVLRLYPLTETSDSNARSVPVRCRALARPASHEFPEGIGYESAGRYGTLSLPASGEGGELSLKACDFLLQGSDGLFGLG